MLEAVPRSFSMPPARLASPYYSVGCDTCRGSSGGGPPIGELRVSASFAGPSSARATGLTTGIGGVESARSGNEGALLDGR